MSTCIFLLWLVSIPLVFHANANPQTRDYLISCGSSDVIEEGPHKYVPDKDYISTGNVTNLNRNDILPSLQTLRFFPNAKATKHCYSIPVMKEAKYLVKTVYFYGGFDGGTVPPLFDQIIDGTKWSTVNTTEDYASGGSSYYEAIVVAQNKFLSVCLARNEHSVAGSSPFISSLEVHYLDSSVYNSTKMQKTMLVTVSRNSFGSDEDIISYPDDNYNRLWLPFKDENLFVSSQSSVTSSIFWNIPPQKVFTSALTSSKGNNLTLNWPPFPLPAGLYYIALYFQDNRSPSPYSWRVFDVYINGQIFYQNINVSDSGLSIVGTEWPLQGNTEITLVPAADSPVGPLINAGEVFQIVPFGKRTVTRDVVAIEQVRKGLVNHPEDWVGDPCLPVVWTGLFCSSDDPSRVMTFNLTGAGLSGNLAAGVSKLTALKHLWLGDNKLSGTIPDLSALRSLETLHLENNQFEGPVPSAIGELPNLKEVHLQNNKLNISVPEPLTKRDGVSIKLS